MIVSVHVICFHHNHRLSNIFSALKKFLFSNYKFLFRNDFLLIKKSAFVYSMLVNLKINKLCLQGHCFTLGFLIVGKRQPLNGGINIFRR
jgi:hypothetical protein